MLSNNEQKERRSRINALAGTILFHALVIALLLLLALHASQPQAEDGVEVNLNYFAAKDTLADSLKTATVATDTTSASATEISAAKSDRPEVMPIRRMTRQDKQDEMLFPNAKKIIETPNERIVNPKIINQPVSAKKGEKNQQPSLPSMANSGNRPSGAVANQVELPPGIQVQLAGRGVVSISKPVFSPSVEGRIVVSIIVNNEGKVVFASSAGRGTNISDIHIRVQAEEAARKTSFVPDKNAPEGQKGTLTYILTRQK